MFIQEALPSCGLDHNPIILQPFLPLSGPRPFWSNLMWLETPGFVEKVKYWWEDYKVEGTASFIIAKKLKHIKRKILEWRKKSLGELSLEKTFVFKRLIAYGRRR